MSYFMDFETPDKVVGDDAVMDLEGDMKLGKGNEALVLPAPTYSSRFLSLRRVQPKVEGCPKGSVVVLEREVWRSLLSNFFLRPN
mmetsp:Transcript_14015/g.39629  ORF Transcript_14015/g.39629 Transcript_14015/m.39629 type:complete len:85 (-) Transcript_14015:372-626(-)